MRVTKVRRRRKIKEGKNEKEKKRQGKERKGEEKRKEKKEKKGKGKELKEQHFSEFNRYERKRRDSAKMHVSSSRHWVCITATFWILLTTVYRIEKGYSRE